MLTGSFLIVEDDASTQEAVLAMLEELGYEGANVVGNGVEAIEALRESTPDVMMLDLMMPRMDGFEVLRELRKGSAPRPAHIIVMSAHANKEERAGVVALGADQFLGKPFTLDELQDAIAKAA